MSLLPTRAWLNLDGWSGRSRTAVTVIGKTPKRWRIRNDSNHPIRLAGRNRWLDPGATALVPLYAVSARAEAGR